MRKILLVLSILFVSINCFGLAHIPESVSGYLNTDGDQLEDGYVAYYSTSSLTTFKDVYSDYNGNTVVSQSGNGIQLNSAGQPTSSGSPVVLFGDGIYWIVIRDEDGVIVNTYESVNYSEASSESSIPWIDIGASYGFDDSDIQKAISDYTDTSIPVIFLFKGDFTISSSQELLSHVGVYMVNGSEIDINSGNTLTISSDRVSIENNSEFVGTGTLTFNGSDLKAEKNTRVFATTLTVNGNLANDNIYSAWFGPISGDGLDDATALQKAFDFSDSLIINGDYDISTQIEKTSGTTFKMTFDIGGKISLLSNFAPTGDLQTGSAVFLNNIPNVEVYNFQYDGNRAALGYTENIVHAGVYVLNATDNVKIKGGFLENSPGNGVRVKLSKNVNIEELVITNNMFHPINFDTCEKVYVKRNNIYGIGNQGTNVNIGGIGILGATCEYVWIEDNYIKNMSDTGTKTQESSEVYYLNNKVYDSGKDGIKVQSEGVGGVNAHLIGNTVDSIYYWRDDGSFLIGAIDFDNVILKDNILKGGSKATGTEDAIRITTGSQNNTNVTIEGNQAYGVVSAFMTINDVTGNLTVVDNQGDRPINLDDIFGDVKFNDNIVRFATYSTTEDNVQFISDARTIDFSNNTLEGGLRGLLLQPNSVDGNAIKINENVIRGTAEDGVRIGNFGSVTSNIISLSIMGNDFYDICRNNTASRAGIRFSNDKVNLSHLKIKDNNGYSLQIPGDRLIALQGSGTKIGLASFSENYFNGVVESVFDTGRIEQFASGGRTSATPTVGSYENGDIVMNSAPSGTEPIGWVCSTSGTFGTLTGVTGNITTGTVELTVNDASDLNLYQYINIAGVTGTKKIIKVDGTTITIDSSADATVSGASVSYQTPVFTNFGQLY